jgi:hypothetical protein
MRLLAVELRCGGEVHCGAGAAMPHLHGLADALGWVLALVARATADRAHLDLTRSLFSLSAYAGVATGPRVGATARRRGCHRRGIALRVIANVGLRPIAAQLDVPDSTVRTWWQRFRARSPTTLAHCSALAVVLDGTAVVLTTDAERGALDGLLVAWQRAQIRSGGAVGELWRFWSRISGGEALGTKTTSPWAGGSGADWMAASHFGGHLLERTVR